MTVPSLLLMHPAPDVRARVRASFAGLPVHLVTTADAGTAGSMATAGTRLIITEVAQASWARGLADALRASGTQLPALALLAPFEAEPQAFQAGAVALVSHPLAPAEAQALAALASAPESLAALSEAMAHSRIRGGSGKALELLAGLIARESGAALAWAQYHSAALLLTEGKLQEALEELSALVDEQPSFWRAHERLAAVWDVADDPDAAKRHRALAADIRQRLQAESDSALAAHPPPAAPEATRAEVWTPTPEASAPAGASVQTATPDIASGPASAAPLPHQADIIVADDSELVREMVTDVLERAGYLVRQASNGSEALELARAKRPDIMILDGLMPGKTGFDACKEIKEVMYPRNAPKVLIFSAIYTKQRQRSEAVSLYKVDEVLAKPTDKPLDEAELLAMVRRHLPR